MRDTHCHNYIATCMCISPLAINANKYLQAVNLDLIFLSTSFTPSRQVHSWLQTVFSEGEVPPYEVNSGTLDTLYKMASQCEEREAQAQLLLNDLEQKTTEYQAESE